MARAIKWVVLVAIAFFTISAYLNGGLDGVWNMIDTAMYKLFDVIGNLINKVQSSDSLGGQ